MMRHDDHTATWKPLHSLKIQSIAKITVTVKAGRSVAGISFRKLETRVDVSGQEVIEAFWESRALVIATTFDSQPAIVTFKIRPSPTLQTTYEYVIKIQEAVKKYTMLAESLIEKEPDTSLNYGVSLTEVNPMTKNASSLANVTLNLLKEQKSYDEVVSNLATSMEEFLLFADRPLEDAFYDDAELLEPIVERFYKLIVEPATFICGYVRNRLTDKSFESSTLLEEEKIIRDLAGQFKRLEKDLDLTVPEATLRAITNIEKEFIRERLHPFDKASYQDDRGCMDGTRTRVINDSSSWVDQSRDYDTPSQSSTDNGMLWIYGMPGIGKSAIAHSICRRFHESRQLAGSFFCRRDDPILSDTKRIPPTLIYGLASVFRPYRNLVAQALRDDPQIGPDLACVELFLSPLQSLKARPLRTLAVVIDALDECGEPATRMQLLGHLFNACQQNKWLKVIVISRPEKDIRSFFNATGVVGQDLGQDDHSRTDIRHFTKVRMKIVAEELHVSQNPEPWVGERQLDHIVNRSGGLFLFVETLGQYLMKYRNPKQPLDRLLAGPAEEASIELHKLYLAAIESRVDSEEAESRLIARAVIGVAPHRALCDEAIAALTGIETGIVSSWVDDLGSLLYRDTTIQRGIRVRHISIFEYLIGPFCPLDFRIDLKQANIELGVYCLRTMMTELRFNICELETSYRSNAEIQDLNERVRDNISDILQYSCLYWCNHLCSSLEPASKEICDYLDTFLRGERVLYWLEVLSVMGKVPAGIGALRLILACNKIFNEGIVNLVEDILRFVLAFSAPISTSAPHIYLSALPFTPSDSSLWKTACASFPKLMTVSEGQMTKWLKIEDLWKGHTGGIVDIAYSPDGLNVVSGSHDNTVRIWDAKTGAPIGEPLKGHTERVTSVAYSPDGRNIISGSWDKMIRIWEAATGTPVAEPLTGHIDAVTSLAYSPDGNYIVSGSFDCTVRIWDAVTGAPIGEPSRGHADNITSVAYSPDGFSIVSGSFDHTLRIWNAATGAPVGKPLKGHTHVVESVAYSPDSQYIVSGSWDKMIRIWDAATGTPLGAPLAGHTDGIQSVAYSPNGQNIVSSSNDHTIRIWDAKTGVPVCEPLNGHSRSVASVTYSPNGRNIASGSSDKTIRTWDAVTGTPIAEPLMGHTNLVMDLAYSPDGNSIVSCSWDRTIRIWDAETGFSANVPFKAHNNGIQSVAYSPDGRNIVSGDVGNLIRIWDAKTGGPVAEPLKEHTRDVKSVAYSPDGRNVASGSSDQTIRIWDAVTGAPVGEPLKGHKGFVASIIYSPDGQFIASGSYDGTIQVWDAAARSPIGEPLNAHPGGVTSIAYSPDGRNIVSGSFDNTIRIWDVMTRTPVGEPLRGHTDGVGSVAYSPDGRNLASGSFDRTIRIWDAITGAPIGDPLKGHLGPITSVAYSPDNRHVISGSSDHTICVWDTRQIPNNDGTVSLGIMGLPPQISDKILFTSSSPNAVSSIALDPKALDSEGWVRCDDGILLWVPEDCRRGVTSHAIRTIPPEARLRCVRLDLSDFKYGNSWTDAYYGSR